MTKTLVGAAEPPERKPVDVSPLGMSVSSTTCPATWFVSKRGVLTDAGTASSATSYTMIISFGGA
jgi:hypothetical protein